MSNTWVNKDAPNVAPVTNGVKGPLRVEDCPKPGIYEGPLTRKQILESLLLVVVDTIVYN
jgi:hypothetical protein